MGRFLSARGLSVAGVGDEMRIPFLNVMNVLVRTCSSFQGLLRKSFPEDAPCSKGTFDVSEASYSTSYTLLYLTLKLRP